jgi:hypothetical protein
MAAHDEDSLSGLKIPREVKFWRSFVTVALILIGGGQYIGPTTQLASIKETLIELRGVIANLTSSTMNQNEQLDRLVRDHETRLRELEHGKLKP